MGLFNFTKSRRYRNFMAKLYGLGAAVVMLGALFKINHYGVLYILNCQECIMVLKVVN